VRDRDSNAPAEVVAERLVVHLLWSGRIGGIERAVAAIVDRPGRAGVWRHRACFLDGRGPVGERLTAAGLAETLRARGGWDVPALVRLARSLRRLRPTILHIHTHALAPLLVARLVAPSAAWVYTEHSPRALGRSLKFDVLYRLLKRRRSRFVAVAPALAHRMEHRGVERSRIVTIPNALTVPPRADDVAASRDGRTLGVVARLEPQKRVDLFIAVVAELKRRGLGVRGVIVGDGSQRRQLEKLRGSFGLAEEIEFVGEHEDVTPWLDTFDLFLATSAVEPFGIAVLEALARRVPVVAMPCDGGLSHLLEQRGLVLADRAITTAADAVASLLGSPDALAQLRARADSSLDRFTVGRVVAELEALYGRAATPRSL
jgi:glycosyltransferase involved in cell wall biosynthesis